VTNLSVPTQETFPPNQHVNHGSSEPIYKMCLELSVTRSEFWELLS